MSRFKAPRRPGVFSRLRWLLTVLPILFVAAGTYYVLNSPWLTVQEVRIRGTESLDQASLIEIAGLEGRSMFGLPVDGARARLPSLRPISAVAIERACPAGVTLAVGERLPAAFWSVAGQTYVVSADGFVLGGGGPEGPAVSIVEVGHRRRLHGGGGVPPDAIALAQRIFKESPRFLGEDVEVLEYRAVVGVTAVFHDG